MTIEKNDKVTIPVWLLSIIISLLIAGFTAWGVSSGQSAETKVRLNHVERDMEQKVNKDEFQIVVDELRDIKRILMNKK